MPRRSNQAPPEVGGQAQAVPAIEDLYRLPLDDFTRARNQLSKDLKARGERALADLVAGLRKPSAVLWTVNQLAASDPEGMADLLDTGARLKEAQRRLLGGDREARAALREATQKEQPALQRLLAHASAIGRGGGPPISPAILERVRETLRQAAMADEEIRSDLAGGRLRRELGPIGFGGLESLATEPPVRPRPESTAEEPEVAGPQARRAAIRRVAELRRRAEAAATEAEQLGKHARAQAQLAESTRQRAARLAERAQEAARQAAEAAEVARRAGGEAEAAEAAAAEAVALADVAQGTAKRTQRELEAGHLELDKLANT